MPKGIHLPKGRVFGSYKGNDRKDAYPFKIKNLMELDVDPSEWKPRWSQVTEERFAIQIDPRQAFLDLPLNDYFRLFSGRKYIVNNSRKHPLFEVLMHLIFTSREERILAYIACWYIRDELSYSEISRRLGKRRGKPISKQTVVKYCKYVTKRVNEFIRKSDLKNKLWNSIEKEKEEDGEYPEDVREMLGG